MHNKVRILSLVAMTACAVTFGFAAKGLASSATVGHLEKNKAVLKQTLSFYNTHTNEKVTVAYQGLEKKASQNYSEISKIMFDHRAKEVKQVDPRLVDLLFDIQTEVKRRYPNQDTTFHIISGYRAPKTNSAMRAKGGGQAKNSRHSHGDAMDIRMPGIKTTELRDIAYCLKRGGVGMYNGSDFVHVDVWNVRTWNWTPNANTCKS
jgi:uncharacterized protein YcbK (DUF882 family)